MQFKINTTQVQIYYVRYKFYFNIEKITKEERKRKREKERKKERKKDKIMD